MTSVVLSKKKKKIKLRKKYMTDYENGQLICLE